MTNTLLSVFPVVCLPLFVLISNAYAGDAPHPPVSAGEMTDILDIQPLAPSIGWPSSLIFWGIAALAVLLLAGFFAVWWRRRNRGTAPPVVEVPAWERAGAELDHLHEGRHELTDRAFYFELSRILRGYIEARFGFPALEMTSEELIPAMKSVDLSHEVRSAVSEFIRRSDMVKFAGRTSAPDMRETDLKLARTVVELSIPRMPEEEEK